MFRLEEDIFSAEEKAPQNPKLTWQDGTGGVKGLDSPVNRESPSSESPEVRSRIGSDPPLPESEVPDEVGAFRARSRSAPPILWAAQRYGRELRRMSDEFHGALENLPRPKSAGTAIQMHRTSGWKETLQSWWHPRSPDDGAPRSPP